MCQGIATKVDGRQGTGRDSRHDLDVVIGSQGEAGRGIDPVSRTLPGPFNDDRAAAVDAVGIITQQAGQCVIATCATVIQDIGAIIAGDRIRIVRSYNIFDIEQIVGAVQPIGIGHETIEIAGQVHLEGFGIGGIAEVQRVGVIATIDIACIVVAGQQEAVIAIAAIEVVLVEAAVDHVIASAAIDRVEAAAAGDRVIAVIARQHIGHAVADDRVRSGRADHIFHALQIIGAVGAFAVRHVFVKLCGEINQVGHGGQGRTHVQRVRAAAAIGIVTVIAEGHDKTVIAIAAIAAVLVQPAIQRVIAGAAIERVQPLTAKQFVCTAHAVQLVDRAAAIKIVIAVAADRMFDIGEADAHPVDRACDTIQTDHRVRGNSRGIDRIGAAIAVTDRRGMARDTVIIGIFVGEDITVITRGHAIGADHDIRDRQHITAGIIDHPHCPGALRAFAAEGLAFEGPGAVVIGAARHIVDQLAHRAIGRDQIDLHIGGEGGREGHLHGHAFDDVVEGGIAAETQPSGIAIRDHRGRIQHIHRIGEFVR